MNELKIKDVEGMCVFDSRGNPTVQAKVILENGVSEVAMCPSGASTGSFEAVELRDADFQAYNGMGVDKAVQNINTKIKKSLIGMNVYNQREIDEKMIKLDGTVNKAKLGANSILAVSIAACKAAALSLGLEPYQYIGGISGNTIPLPMINILNGGKHSDNNVNIQEFMIVPVGASDFQECMKMCTEVYHSLRKLIKQKGMSNGVGDEGGFAPNLHNDEQAIELILEAISNAGYAPDKDFMIALDMASTEMREEAKKINKNGYYMWKTDEYKEKEEMIEFIIELIERYPIMSIEDGLSENDWKEWAELTKKVGNKVDLVGDDLFVTNRKRLEKGIKNKVANSILIKPNQIGTVTETLETIKLAKKNGYKTIISHRSGETEDTFIADLAIGVNAGQIKMGAPCRSERVAKYNRILNIEKML